MGSIRLVAMLGADETGAGKSSLASVVYEAVTHEQRAVCEQIEHDLRLAQIGLSEPYMSDFVNLQDLRDLIFRAHDIVEAALLERKPRLGRTPKTKVG